MVKIVLNRLHGDYGFEARDEDGHIVNIDGAKSIGGMGAGARPMQLLLMGLGGCAGIDVISILKKQRQVVEDISIEISGEREENKTPSLWRKVNVLFKFTGNIDETKATKACTLSIEKHCSVAETLRRSGTQIQWTLKINSES